VNGVAAKPATRVRTGDEVSARAHGRPRVLDVVSLIDKRVGAAVAAECFVDRSPPPSPRQGPADFVREPSTGRPTKRERRALDRLRGRGGPG